MKKISHYFYSLSLMLSGSCLVLMTLFILAQVTAKAFGVVIPSSDDFARWLLSAAIFFGLAYTFNAGGHIRVTMLINRLSSTPRRVLEGINLCIATIITGFLSYNSIFAIFESLGAPGRKWEVTDTYLVLPIWLVKLPMAIGSLFLFIAVLDSLVQILRNKTPKYIIGEDEIGNTDNVNSEDLR